MNLTSFLANKCFEYLLKYDSERENVNTRTFHLQKSKEKSTLRFIFSPPWAVETKHFEALCDGCGECIAACENNILILNKNGCPQVDFSRGACTFCGACAESCPQEAFQYDPSCAPWNLHALINAKCLIKNNVVCSTCAEQCDKEAIVISRIIDKDKAPRVTDLCDGCGACFSVCPVGAIEICQLEYQEQP